jgi:hypothetical protein
MGERDVVADPRGEPRACSSAASVDLFVCQRMAHMHNFAGTPPPAIELAELLEAFKQAGDFCVNVVKDWSDTLRPSRSSRLLP